MKIKERECEQLKLISFLKSENFPKIYIKGLPGTGKTFTTLKTLELLKYDYLYYNCATNKNILQEIENLEKTKKKKTKKIKIFNKKPKIKQTCNIERSNNKILIIDEIDLLKDKNNALYYLISLPYSMILITNNLLLPPKLKSRLTKIIIFSPLSSDKICKMFNIDNVAVKRCGITGDLRKVSMVAKYTKKMNNKESNEWYNNWYHRVETAIRDNLNVMQLLIIEILKNKNYKITDLYFEIVIQLKQKYDVDFIDYCDILETIDLLKQLEIIKITKQLVKLKLQNI